MDDYTNYKDFYDSKINKTLHHLKRNGFNALFEPRRKQALGTILSKIPSGMTVGLGGSLTLRQLNIVEHLEQLGHKVFDHWRKGLDPVEVNNARLNQLRSDIFITSTNAVTIDGKLVNIDGIGNRVASMLYGSKKVLVVAGYNKIVQDVQSGIEKIKNEIAPKNALRLNKVTPCVKAGHCTDCKGAERLCRITTIIEAKPMLAEDFTIIIVGEKLGL